jgi:hypothetical protein
MGGFADLRTHTLEERMNAEYRSFRDFYPAYLAEHKERSTRRLHFVGTLLVIVVLVVALWRREGRWLLLAPLFGYGLAWIGHFVFERNRPATFRHPLYSLAGDFVMFKDMLLGRLPW